MVNSNDVVGWSVFSVFEFAVVIPGGGIVIISGLVAVVASSVAELETIVGISGMVIVVCSVDVE